jgi:hypothetical protein
MITTPRICITHDYHFKKICTSTSTYKPVHYHCFSCARIYTHDWVLELCAKAFSSMFIRIFTHDTRTRTTPRIHIFAPFDYLMILYDHLISYLYTCIHVCIYIYIHTYRHAIMHIHVYMCTCMYTYIYMCTHTWMYVQSIRKRIATTVYMLNTYICMYIYIRT